MSRIIAATNFGAVSSLHMVTSPAAPTTDAAFVRLGFLNAEDVRMLRERHVVGDILGQFFDADGNVVELPIPPGVVIQLADLRGIPQDGRRRRRPAQVEATLGALRAGFWTSLVTNASPRSACSSSSGALAPVPVSDSRTYRQADTRRLAAKWLASVNTTVSRRRQSPESAPCHLVSIRPILQSSERMNIV